MGLRRSVGVCTSLLAPFIDYSETDDLNWVIVRSLEGSVLEAGIAYRTSSCQVYIRYPGFETFYAYLLSIV